MAYAINALSQRVIELEEHQAVLDLKLNNQNIATTNEEIKMLNGVDLLLKEYQELFGSTSTNQIVNDSLRQGEVDSGSFAT